MLRKSDPTEVRDFCHQKLENLRNSYSKLSVQFVLFMFLSSLLLQSPAVGFEEGDLESPRVEDLKLVQRPSKENNWIFLLTLKTSDDKNLVQLPKFSLTFAWKWREKVDPPPKCQTVDRVSVDVSVHEQIFERVFDKERVTQSFVAFGRIPAIPALPQGCQEFRLISEIPVVALNGKGIVKSQSKPLWVTTYSGEVYEPNLEDASGRRFVPNKPSKTLTSKDWAFSEWPADTRVVCMTQQDAMLIDNQAQLFSALDFELLRAEEIESSAKLPEIRQFLDARVIAKTVLDIARKPLRDLSDLLSCEKPIRGSQVISSLKGAISSIKKSNDEYVKSLERESNAAAKAAKAETLKAQTVKLKQIDEKIRSSSITYSEFAKDLQDLTRANSSQVSGVNFGKPKETLKTKNDFKSKRDSFRLRVDESLIVLRDLELEIIDWENSTLIARGINSNSFESQYLKKLTSLRDAQKKLIVLFMRFENFYRSKTS